VEWAAARLFSPQELSAGINHRLMGDSAWNCYAIDARIIRRFFYAHVAEVHHVVYVADVPTCDGAHSGAASVRSGEACC
jgi:hypothetical protein